MGTIDPDAPSVIKGKVVRTSVSAMQKAVCIECKQSKNPSDFYHHPEKLNGCSSRCKECAAARCRLLAKDPARVAELKASQAAAKRDRQVKACGRCGQTKDQADFYTHPRTVDGRTTTCKKCIKARSKTQQGRHRAFDTHLRGFGIDRSWWDRVLVEQAGRCPVCERALNPHAKHNDTACIDHCHTTGRARAILCANCNAVLGLIREAAATADRLRDYIERVCR